MTAKATKGFFLMANPTDSLKTHGETCVKVAHLLGILGQPAIAVELIESVTALLHTNTAHPLARASRGHLRLLPSPIVTKEEK